MGGLSLGSPTSAVFDLNASGPFPAAPSATSLEGARLSYTLNFERGTADLSGFVGTGTFSLQLLQSLSIQIVKDHGFSSSAVHQAGLTVDAHPTGTVTVTYGYTPGGPVVPEPEEWAALAALGILGWAGLRRGRASLAASRPDGQKQVSNVT